MVFRFLAVCAAFLVLGLATGAYSRFKSIPIIYEDARPIADNQELLPQRDEFEQLARADPVGMLGKSLVRYQREVKAGCSCTLDKEEWINGKLLPQEIISLCVRGDVPDPDSGKTRIEVLMKWRSGLQTVLGSKLNGILYLEDRAKGRMTTWRKDAPFFQEKGVDIDSPSARGASRYCIRDAGLYRGTMRTYEVWKQRKDEGTLVTEYLGCKPVEKAGGVECHIIKRTCKSPELDSFELGGKPDQSSSALERDGFTQVTIMVDARRWLQVGTELRRSDGQLIGAYYFRDVELNREFEPDTFDKDGLLKK